MKTDTFEGRTPLHHVAVDVPPAEQGEATRRLLAEGHDPNAKDRRGWTPLHAAAEYLALDVARELIEAGAVVDATDDHGNTPLFRAVFTSRGKGDMIQLLRSHGASPTVRNRHGVTPVTLARSIGNYDVRQWFADVWE